MTKFYDDETDPQWEHRPKDPKKYKLYCKMRDFARQSGLDDVDLVHGIFENTARYQKQAKRGNGLQDYLLASIISAKPHNIHEAMMAIQMTVVDMHLMDASARLMKCDYKSDVEKYTKQLHTLSRTYNAQVDTLSKARRGGEQKVTVQHITISENAQAIVGNVGSSANDGAPFDRKTLTHSEAATAPVIDLNSHQREMTTKGRR